MIPARLQWGPFWEYSRLCLSEPDFRLLQGDLPGADLDFGPRVGKQKKGVIIPVRSLHEQWLLRVTFTVADIRPGSRLSPRRTQIRVSPLLGIKQLCPKTMPDSVTHPTRENAGTPFWAFLVQCPRGALMNSVRT